jgi:hypothetical protein
VIRLAAQRYFAASVSHPNLETDALISVARSRALHGRDRAQAARQGWRGRATRSERHLLSGTGGGGLRYLMVWKAVEHLQYRNGTYSYGAGKRGLFRRWVSGRGGFDIATDPRAAFGGRPKRLRIPYFGQHNDSASLGHVAAACPQARPPACDARFKVPRGGTRP